MGDCGGATQSEYRWSFPVTAFDLVIYYGFIARLTAPI